jgi:hypothetical protein
MNALNNKGIKQSIKAIIALSVIWMIFKSVEFVFVSILGN